jgi:subtilisin family serine protease
MRVRGLSVTTLACLSLLAAGGCSPRTSQEREFFAPSTRSTAAWSAIQRRNLHASGVVDEDLIAALDEQETVRAIILFGMTGASPFSEIATASDSHGSAMIRSKGEAILSRFDPGEFELIWQFTSLGALAGRISRAGLLRASDDPNILRIGLDPPVIAQLAEAVPFGSLDAVHDLGFTGEGVTVAVVDTGIDTDHPDLSDDLVDERCFCSAFGGCCPDGSTSQSGPGSAEDDAGHGTTAAGIITSRGLVAPPGGAPDAGILAVKAGERRLDVASAISDVLTAGFWILNFRTDVDVISMSLATPMVFPGPCDDYDAATRAASIVVGELRKNGVVLVASAGNAGSGTGMGLPACLSGVIGVGALYDDDFGSETHFDETSGFSCIDPTTQADQVTCFSNSDSTTVVFASGAHVVAPGLGGGVTDFGGTSAAAPLVASCAALLKQKHSAVTPASVEVALGASATWVTDPKNGLSFPRLDCAEALAALPACDDGIDNDSDGFADYPDDLGCLDAIDPSEKDDTGTYPCDDGIDNDDDGYVDYPDDVGCYHPYWFLEDPACQNGSDDDGDGLTDLADPGCITPFWMLEDPACQNGSDDDGDGLIDFDGGQAVHGACSAGTCPPGVSDPDLDGIANPDPQCFSAGTFNERSCGLGAELALVLLTLMWLHRRRARTG